MRIIVIILIVLLAQCVAYTQKHDYNWVIGTNSNWHNRGGMIMRFNPSLERIDTFVSSQDFRLLNSSFSTSDGALLMYSNGCDIKDYNDNHICTINQSTYHDAKCPTGMDIANGLIFLQQPLSDSIVYAFHLFKEYSEHPVFYVEISKLLYTKLNVNSTITPVEIDVPIATDTFDYSYLAAVKHGNGRDWWILMPLRWSYDYYSVLLDPNGIKSVDKHSAEVKLTHIDFATESCFSPDGSWYARGTWKDKIKLFEFDRCTGKLHNGKTLDFPISPDSIGRFGLAFSQNSRFLYLSLPYKIHQYDLWTDDISASRVVVAQWDGTSDPFPTGFSFMELAPDGKIYVKTAHHSRYLHVIDSPDEKGIECNFKQLGLELPKFHTYCMPTFPGNYRLGPLPDKCATAIEDSYLGNEVTCYPNPFTTEIRLKVVEGLNAPWSIQFFDALGRTVLKEEVNTHGETLIQGLSNHQPGILFYRITDRMNKVVKSGKVVKL